MAHEQAVNAIASFDWTTFDSPSTAVVTTVASEAEVDPVAIDPIYEAIDPDSLDQLLTSTSYSHSSPHGSIEFAYHDYWVVVKPNGRGYIHDLDSRPQTSGAPRQVEATSRGD